MRKEQDIFDELATLPSISRLNELAGRLEVVVRELPQYLSLLDAVAGAIFALMRAQELNYKHRDRQLSEAYVQNLASRLKRMTQGQLPRKHAWLAGFYFNSALQRIAAAGEQLEGILRRHERTVTRSGMKFPDAISMDSVRTVRNEVDRFKHDETGFERGRDVTDTIAIQSIGEIVDTLDRHKSLLKGASPISRRHGTVRSR